MTSTDKQEALKLFNDVSNWVSHQNGWHAQTEIQEDDAAGLPGLRIDTNKQERVHLELLGRRSDGSLLVEMYAWPTLVRVRLRNRPDYPGWKVVTDGGRADNARLGRTQFRRVGPRPFAIAMSDRYVRRLRARTGARAWVLVPRTWHRE